MQPGMATLLKTTSPLIKTTNQGYKKMLLKTSKLLSITLISSLLCCCIVAPRPYYKHRKPYRHRRYVEKTVVKRGRVHRY
jgi:hypothetical protein